MRLSSNEREAISKVKYLIGSVEMIEKMLDSHANIPFGDDVLFFLDEVSKEIMKNPQAKQYSDVITFAFWIRKAATFNMKQRFEFKDEYIHLGKGIVFHVAPSNVPVNFAYSLVTGLLTGNANVVRVPSKDYPQVDIIIKAFKTILAKHVEIEPFVICIKYDRDKKVNDFFSSIADMRIVWGGDKTISELRKSPLPPRSGEITFADRYSIAVIDSDTYMGTEDKKRIAEDFYNDTFFSDQNACTSPRIVIWTGNKIHEAKELFWEGEHKLVEKKYSFQPIQAINKLTQSYVAANALHGAIVEKHVDNLIVRVRVPDITSDLMNYRDNSGYFYEYDCGDLTELSSLLNDKRCQTLCYIGKKDEIIELINSGIKGVDRVVPIGKAMDFDLIWDGYNLSVMLTRSVSAL